MSETDNGHRKTGPERGGQGGVELGECGEREPPSTRQPSAFLERRLKRVDYATSMYGDGATSWRLDGL
jgi:hypothetical protein